MSVQSVPSVALMFAPVKHAEIDLYDLIPDPVERAVVQVQASGWHLFGQVDYIAEPLRLGSIVNFQCGPTWCALAAEGAAVDISAALLALGIVHTHAVIGEEGFWSIVFAPLGVLS